MDPSKKEQTGGQDQTRVEHTNSKAVVPKTSQQTACNQAKSEVKPTGGYSPSNIFQATLQKMFHMEAPSDKSKSTRSSKTSSACSESDEERIESLTGLKIGEVNPQEQRFFTPSGTTNAESRVANTTAQKPRFQKARNGSHIHNLQPRKVHRMQNFLKELGLVHGTADEKPQSDSAQTVRARPLPRQSNSEASFTEKYGKCHEVIGKGAFGIVRIAHKVEPKVPGEKLFAVKEFKKRANEHPKKYIKRLTSEFCISSSLQHINVIDTLDLLQDTQGNYCEVMEYCAGGDLYSLIAASGGLEPEEADCFFGQLINGVRYLHDNGVAHRDLKPENLILTSTGCLKITDFGNGECFRMAWETQAHLSRGICGSEPYIAPEEFTDAWFDPRLVDIWACGIIYMGMITGRQLWRIAKAQEDGNFKTFLQARAQGEILAPFQGLTNSRRRIICRIIEPNPKLRITGEQIMQDQWFSRLNICHKSHVPPTATTKVTCGDNAAGQHATGIDNSTFCKVVQ